MAIAVDPKDPDERLLYKIDWTALLDGDTITSVDWAVEDGSCTIELPQNTTTETSIWVLGGTLDEKCLVRCRITCASTAIMDRTLSIKIKAK